MADDILVVTETDVQDKNLLLRFLRKVINRLQQIFNRLAKLEAAPPPPTFPQIRKELSATGSAPLNVQSLAGQLAQPQKAGVPLQASQPSNQVLQQYDNSQLVLVGNTIGNYDFYSVVGGNPNSLLKLTDSLSYTCRVVQTAATSLTNNANTTIAFDTEAWDNGNLHDNATNNSRITVPADGAGTWLIAGGVSIPAGAAGTKRRLFLQGNGAAVLASQDGPFEGTKTILITVNTVVQMVAGDYIELIAFQDSGAAQNTNTGFGATWMLAVRMF